MVHRVVNEVVNGDVRRVAGLGFRGAATTEALRAALHMALSHTTESPQLTALATAADKADTPAFTQLAAEWGLPIIAVPLPELVRQEAAASAAVPARYGQRSLAESAALAGAGPGARLLVARCLSDDGLATAAIAENTGP